MGSQLHKQTREDTSVRKQIVALLFLRATDSRKRRWYNQGQERTLKPAFFCANDRHLVPNKLIVRYRVLGGVYPLTSCIVSPQYVVCKDIAIIASPKILLIYLKPGSWLSRSWFSFFVRGTITVLSLQALNLLVQIRFPAVSLQATNCDSHNTTCQRVDSP